jgi:hypothetical protein
MNPMQLERAQSDFVCESYCILKFYINNKKSTSQRTRGKMMSACMDHMDDDVAAPKFDTW